MKNKHLSFVLAVLMSMATSVASAHDVEINGIYYNLFTKAKQATVTFRGDSYSAYSNEYSGTVTIPASITYEGNTYSVTSIGERAFDGCSGLTSVTIPNSVTSIGSSAFANCSGLTSVTIPNSVTSIGNYAFYDCSGLTSITIPNSVTSFGVYAFTYCRGLTSITIPNSVTDIGHDTFYGCTGLTFVTISNSVASIGGYTFANCSGLTSVTIPNSVTSIDNSAFKGCTGLTSVTIGKGVTKIYGSAFAQCGNLEEVYCYAVNVPSTSSDAFRESMVEYATLYVPEESINAYKAKVPWSGFGTKKPLSGETPNKKCATPTINYANGKLTFTCETEGAQFVSEITDTDIKKHYDAEVNLSVTYTIKVYATLTGYDDSDVATATLCWIEQEPASEGLGTDVKEIASMPVLIQSQGGTLRITGTANDTPISAYTVGGQLLDITTSNGGAATLRTNLHDGIVIVKVGKRTYKISL